MTVETREHRPMDAHDLFLTLNRFIDENTRHHDVERRWLADLIIPVHRLVRELKAGGVGGLTPEQQKQFRDFRLAEIDEEQSKLDKAKKALDDEAQKIKRAAA